MRIGLSCVARRTCPKPPRRPTHVSFTTKQRRFFLIYEDDKTRHGATSTAFCHYFSTISPFSKRAESNSRHGAQTIKTASTYQERTVKNRKITPKFLENNNHNDESSTLQRVRPPVVNDKKLKSIENWIRKLDLVLPLHLRECSSADKNDIHVTEQVTRDETASDVETPTFVLNVLQKAGRSKVDLLTYMGIEQSRWKAVLWLTETLLHDVASPSLDPQALKVPSNLTWGGDNSTFNSLTREPFSVDIIGSVNSQPVRDRTTFDADLSHHGPASRHHEVMAQVWYSVGSLIIEAAALPEDQAEVVMAVVYQIIAKVHAHGLIPDNIYSYMSSHYTSVIQRPPILYLLSSRILTTLSDATWRSHQMEIIEQAVKLGTPLKSLIKDLPGGRFRLKVRPLGPEVWLEFVLWCCVEGGFRFSGCRIVDLLQSQTKEPWFALPWTSQSANAQLDLIDWERVRARHGGPVGLIEGYNREAPFVEMAPHTVSSEVILSLVQSCIDLSNGFEGRHGLSRTILERISSLLNFLEPHSLPNQYFDFLGVRVLQSGLFEFTSNPNHLEFWARKVAELRSLQTRTPLVPASATFKVENVFKQSEVQAGLLHQAMGEFVDKSDVRSAAVVFNSIQEHVDASKLQSISSFLATTSIEHEDYVNAQGFFTSHTSSINIDFLESHGQLPVHNLAAFLNLATESKLLRIGQWLLFSDDVDEPVISKQMYNKPGLTAALVRYASVSGDQDLLKELVLARKRAPLKPSVSLLRSLVDAFILSYDFREAYATLAAVKKAKGGGFGLSNLTSVATAILDLETRARDGPDGDASVSLHQALALMDRMLSGRFDNRGGDFRIEIGLAHKQQIAALLTVLSQFHWSQITQLTRRWRSKYPLHNLTILSTDLFNALLTSVVNVRGSAEAVRFCKLFCSGMLTSQTNFNNSVLDEYSAYYGTLSDNDSEFLLDLHNGLPSISRLRSDEYIPFIASIDGSAHDAMIPEEDDNTDLEDDMASDNLKLTNGISATSDEIEHSHDMGPMALVKPDLRTLRIIVQGALAEKARLGKHHNEVSQRKEILAWATSTYRQLGVSTKVIEQEIQQAVEGNETDTDETDRRSSSEIRFVVGRQRRERTGTLYQPFGRSRPVMGGNTQHKPA